MIRVPMAATPELQSPPPAMTRCECAGLRFQEIRERLLKGQSFDELARRTGCGQTCTACVPDLEAYLAAHRSGR
jgi:bacterioferritin-associated ferredoxin